MANILIVHPVCDTRRFLCNILFQEGHSVECVSRGRSLFDVLGTRKDIDIVFVRLSGSKTDTWNGKDSVEMARLYGTEAKFIVINGDKKDKPENSHMLSLPFTREELLDAVTKALKKDS